MMTAYQEYQLQWMIDHGYSLQDLMLHLKDLQYADPEDSEKIATPVSELFTEWEADYGFGSEIWACEDEWRDCEGSLNETAADILAEADMEADLRDPAMWEAAWALNPLHKEEEDG